MLSYSIVFLKDKRIKLPPLTFCYKTYIFFKATEAATEGVGNIWNLFLIKFQTSRTANLTKRDSMTGVFL